ncbi:hypothetical protein ACFWRV_18215 [Streptomyces sp. NPDC058576]|uniref:hypothetical protein n=1 Tax=Streptomyces sp. NPDC058576 TaxID=3346547 RepID=UPI0036578877
MTKDPTALPTSPPDGPIRPKKMEVKRAFKRRGSARVSQPALTALSTATSGLLSEVVDAAAKKAGDGAKIRSAHIRTAVREDSGLNTLAGEWLPAQAAPPEESAEAAPHIRWRSFIKQLLHSHDVSASTGARGILHNLVDEFVNQVVQDAHALARKQHSLTIDENEVRAAIEIITPSKLLARVRAKAEKAH